MKTILVPVDFSESSKVATRFAIGIACTMKAKIILLSVINASASSNTLMNWRKLETSMLATSRKDAAEFMEELKSDGEKVNISHQTILGYPIDEMIDQFATGNGVNLIVIGSKGATGLKKIVIGSNASAVLNKSKVPVIVVPQGTKFHPIKKLVYATDMRNLEKDLLAAAEFARMFEAELHVLHVIKKDSARLKEIELDGDLESSEEELKKKAKYAELTLHVVADKEVAAAVDNFVKEVKADMLIMFTHRLDFYEKLFGKSVTRQLSFHSQIPLLAFNRSNY